MEIEHTLERAQLRKLLVNRLDDWHYLNNLQVEVLRGVEPNFLVEQGQGHSGLLLAG